MKVITYIEKNIIKLVLIIIVLFSLLLVLFIPTNMDEFLPYSLLGCQNSVYLKNITNVAPCNGQFDLVANTLNLSLRSYPYVGVSQIILYLPFYFIYKSYVSLRIFHLIFLFLISYFVHRLTKIPFWVSISIFLLSFPLAFQTIIDTGPVFFQVFASVLVPFILIKSYISDSKYRIILSLFAGLILFLGVEQKAVFIWIIPFIYLTTLLIIKINTGKIDIKKIILNFFISLVPLIFLSTMLFSLKTLDDKFYYSYLFDKQSSNNFESIYDWGNAFHEKFIRYFSSFKNYSHRIYPFHTNINLFTLAFWLGFFALFTYQLILKSKYKFYPFVFILFFVIQLLIISLNKESWAGHHVILSFPNILFFIVFSLRNLFVSNFKFVKIFVLLFVISNLLILLTLFINKPNHYSSYEITEIIDFLNTSKICTHALCITADWGVYYPLIIYGVPNQYVADFGNIVSPDKAKILEINKLAKTINTNEVIYIFSNPSKSDKELISAYYASFDKISDSKLENNNNWFIYKASGPKVAN